MCGRYASFLPAEALARLFRTANPLPNIAPSWNIAPSQAAPVVRLHPETKVRHLDLLRWGLLPHFAKDAGRARRPINARPETLTSSGMFRGAFARRRCLVPANAFYEFKATANGKQPYVLAQADGQVMAFGGIWESWRGSGDGVERTFAIITTDPNAEAAAIHDRMPLIVEPADWPLWLGETEGNPAELLRPAPDSTLRIWPVGHAVNSSRNNNPGLIEPAVIGYTSSISS